MSESKKKLSEQDLRKRFRIRGSDTPAVSSFANSTPIVSGLLCRRSPPRRSRRVLCACNHGSRGNFVASCAWPASNVHLYYYLPTWCTDLGRPVQV